MKVKKAILIFGLCLCSLGLSGLLMIAYYNHRSSALPAGTAQKTEVVIAKPETISGKPVELIVPSLGIKLAVADGVYNPKTGAWTLSRDKAHFALLSLPPNNQEGNTVIYGHYRPEVFASLKKIQPGGEAIVRTENGYNFFYKFDQSVTVPPTDTSVFTYKGKPQLTLQTCTGVFMQDRQLFGFSLVRYEKL